MRLARGPEVLLDAEVQLDAVAAEPAPAARGKPRWFLDLVQPEHPAVELAQRRLAARRAGQLHVVDHRIAPSRYLDVKITCLLSRTGNLGAVGDVTHPHA